MATTYLTLVNEVLREINEIPLTSSNFSSAVGIQAFVKESINRSINDIANEEPQLPFFAVAASGETDPFYGNVTVASVAGTRWYTLKASSSSITTDYASIDWDDFYSTTINVSGETAPYVSQSLKFITLTDWRRYLRDSENSDKVYNIHFYAYNAPTALVAYGDAIVLPDQYASVITARTRYYIHQFKENLQQANFAQEDYKRGMRYMKSNLINPQPKNMTDDRVSF